MATEATTTPTSTSSTHLLTPQRVDQLVREHYDPSDYPTYPTELVAAYESLSAQLEEQIPARAAALVAAGEDLTDTARPPVAAHHAWIAAADEQLQELDRQITARLQQRRRVLDGLYRELEPVAAERQRGGAHRYLSAQQWLWHVHEAAAAIARSDKRASVITVAEALAEHARADGVFLAGVSDVQQARGIAHSTWTRAYTWLVEHGLARTLSEQRLLTQLERALAIGSETHAHVHRWRAVIQLQHAARRTLRPAKWVPPARRAVIEESSSKRVVSTDLRPVDNGATRRFGAASPRPTTRKRPGWRSFHPATVTLYKLAVGLAERLSGYLPSNHPILARLGAQMSPQRVELCHALRSASPLRLMPHLDRLAKAGVVDAAGLLVAIEDAEYRSGREPQRRTWDPTRRLIAAVRELHPNDVLDLTL